MNNILKHQLILCPLCRNKIENTVDMNSEKEINEYLELKKELEEIEIIRQIDEYFKLMY
jgi:hypothetical protein